MTASGAADSHAEPGVGVSPVARLVGEVRSASRSAGEVCEAALVRAEELGGAFWEIDTAGARAAADEIDRLVHAGGDPGPLAGAPVAVKDNFAVAGLERRLGLAHATTSDRDAAAVAALRRAGAVVIGTTAMDQLAWTMTGYAPGAPLYANPLLPGRSPGGSSGGAAAAVGAGAVPLALASDSAGSVRVPAVWCGVVGFKPSFGVVSMLGCAPLAVDLDTAGIIVADARDLPQALAALGVPAASIAAAPPRLGVPCELLATAGCDPAVSSAWDAARGSARSFAATVIDVEGRFETRGVGTVFASELAARWAWVLDGQGDIDPAVAGGMDHGSTIRATDYIAARDKLRAAAEDALAVFDAVDALIMPVAPVLPPLLDAPASVAVASTLARPWSVFGWPAVALPLPWAPGAGVQIVGRPGDDARLIAWSAAWTAALGVRTE